MRYPTREYQCANRRRTLPLGQAFNLIAKRVLDSVVHINVGRWPRHVTIQNPCHSSFTSRGKEG